MRRTSRTWVAAVALAGLLLAACGGAQAPGSGSGGETPPATEGGEPIPIGALTPVTGAGSAYGEAMQKTMEIAVREVNEAGGPLGRPFQVYHEDSATDPEQAVRGAQKLIEVNRVVAVLGTWSSAVTMAVAPLTIEAGIIEMNTSGSPDISDLDDNGTVFRTHAHNVMFGRVAAQVAQQRGAATAAVLYNNNPATIAIAEQFTQHFEAGGGQVVESLMYNPNQTSYRSELRQVLAGDPDLVLLASYTPDAAIILREGYEEGADVTWLGPGFAINQQLIDTVGAEIAEGVLAADPIPAVDSPTYEHLEGIYREETGGDIWDVSYAVETYDMVHLLALAIERAGTTDGAALGPALIEISGPPGEKVYSFAEGAALLREGKDIDYEGASSRIDFDERGDVVADFGVFEIRGGSIELIDSVTFGE
ncbi:MAG TPA: ABC transporter substrate-binding protein [Gemmatimonadales bacterium]